MADKQAQQIMEKYAKNCYEAWKFYWIIRGTTWRSFPSHSLYHFHKRKQQQHKLGKLCAAKGYRRRQAQQHWIAWIELRAELTQAAFGFFLVFR